MNLKKYNLLVRTFLVAPTIMIWSFLYIIVVIFSMKKCGEYMTMLGRVFIENADNKIGEKDKMPRF